MKRALFLGYMLLVFLFPANPPARAGLINVSPATFYDYQQDVQLVPNSKQNSRTLTGIPSSNGAGDTISIAKGDNSAFSRVIASLFETKASLKEQVYLTASFTNQVRSPVDSMGQTIGSRSHFDASYEILFDITQQVNLNLFYHAGANDLTSLQPDSYYDPRSIYYAALFNVDTSKLLFEFVQDADQTVRLDPGRYSFFGYHAISRYLYGGKEGDPSAITYATTDGVARIRLTATPVPEPASLGLLAGGLIGVGWLALRRRPGGSLRA